MPVWDCRIIARWYGDDKTKLITDILYHGQTTAKSKPEACNNTWYWAARKFGIDPHKQPKRYNIFRRDYEKERNYKCECNEIEKTGQGLLSLEDQDS